MSIEDLKLTIPAIPEGRMKFGNPAWLAVERAHARVADFLEYSWGLTKRWSLYSNGKKTQQAVCEMCFEEVENGDHYSRVHGLWCHLDCYEDAQIFYRRVNELFPSVYEGPNVKA